MKKMAVVLILLSVAAVAQSLTATTEVLVLTTSTALPKLAQRKAIEIQNLGPNAIFCGVGSSDKAVVNKSRRIDANGGTWALSAPASLPVYCIAATASQLTGAATIVTELR